VQKGYLTNHHVYMLLWHITPYNHYIGSSLTKVFPPRAPFDHILSYGLVRSKREYCQSCSLVVVLC